MEAIERLVSTWMGAGRDQDVQETVTGMFLDHPGRGHSYQSDRRYR